MKNQKFLIAATAILLLVAATAKPAGAVDWKAQWIGAPWDTEEFNRDIIQPAPEFCKDFQATKKIKSATAYVTGLGFFEFFINGKKVGDEVLSPIETSYGHRPGLPEFFISLDDTNWKEFRVPYLTYDVTKFFKKGENKLSALVGNGFFAAGSERWTEPYGSPRFICQVEVKYTDGSEETIVTGPDWKARRSPIVLNDMYHGEIYDARLEDAGEWEPAALRKAPDGALYPEDGPADRVVETLKPQSIRKLDDGSWEVDFKDYVTGWVRLYNISAPAGTEIEIEFPIETKGNGTYKYICSGNPAESYAPRFTWWAFEKAIVKGWPGELKPENIVAEVVHSDVPVAMEFDCSNPLLKKINDIWRRTQTDNMHLSVATDCPHREKGPYTGDGEVSCVTVMHNFAANQFYRKWIRDMIGCQDKETGYVPNGAPWHPGCGGGVPWGSAMCIIPWEHYVHFGDISVLEESFEAMKGYVGWMKNWRLEDGTMFQQMKVKGEVQYWLNLGEWCPPYGLPSENLIHTWYLWRCASYTANAAKALGKDSEAAEYQALADDVAECFHKKFYHPETGSYSAGSGIISESGYGTGSKGGSGDGSNIFALAMGVPADRHDTVVATVKKEFEENNGHLNTGIFGTSLFFDILCQEGLAEEAYIAMTRKDFPSFGWWLEQGATTTWEEWNGNSSHNHPMFGGALVWMYRWIAGVQTDDAEPGYKHIILRPTPVGDLTWADYKTETAYGDLAVRWDLREDGLFKLKTRIPRGAHATVYLPDGSAPIELRSGRRALRCKLSPKTPDKFDDNLVVFMSDLHTKPDGYQPEKLRKVVSEILAMNPLPRNVIALGDLAYLTGQPIEYANLKPILAPLEEAGINLTLAMGNHDRRKEFGEAFPEHAAKSVMNDRYVYIVKTPNADFIVMDSLQEGEDNSTWITAGALNDEQKEWLQQTLADYKKPVFVCSHHTIGETGLTKILSSSPTCCGYIYGHIHRWCKSWTEVWGNGNRVVRTLSMPSTGHWGDIGYVTLHLDSDKAVATLHESEFFFPTPPENPDEAPAQWKVFPEEYDGDTCTFTLK